MAATPPTSLAVRRRWGDKSAPLKALAGEQHALWVVTLFCASSMPSLSAHPREVVNVEVRCAW
eukprot:2736111-Alexandrium_andersonii.AAC.1